jgi:hypothetical protein
MRPASPCSTPRGSASAFHRAASSLRAAKLRSHRVLRALLQDRRGVTAVEFALISGPLFMLLFGGVDLAYQGYLYSVTKGAVADASRRATVESPDLPGVGQIRDRMKELISREVHSMAPSAEITVTPKSYSSFSDIRKPEKLIRDVNGNGAYNAGDGDCFEDMNDNGSHDMDGGKESAGYAGDVVLYSVNVTMPRIFPAAQFIGLGKNYDLTVETVVRNQPYDAQKTPPVICGK